MSKHKIRKCSIKTNKLDKQKLKLKIQLITKQTNCKTINSIKIMRQ